MRQAATITALAGVLTAVLACQPLGQEQGQVGLRVQFPSAAFQVQVIPATTSRIEVAVSGEGMSGPQTASLTKSQPALTISVPAGPKQVTARAFDATGKPVASGSSAVTVIARSKVQAIVTLVPTPDASPSPSGDPSAVASSDPPASPPPTPASPPPPSPTPMPTAAPTATPTPVGGGALPTPTPTPVATVSGQIYVIPPNVGPGNRDL
jgi:hypothetical protein